MVLLFHQSLFWLFSYTQARIRPLLFRKLIQLLHCVCVTKPLTCSRFSEDMLKLINYSKLKNI